MCLNYDYAGLGFIFGLSISLLSIRTENFLPQYNGNFLKDLDAQWRRFHNGTQETDEVEEAHKGENKLAAELAEKVKVLCWVMTGPTNHQAKVKGGFILVTLSR